MPRFVVLRHELPADSPRPSHFDLLLEAGDSLRSFALPSFPSGGALLDVERLPPHRSIYLTYEGPVSGNRGSVMRIAAGTYEIVSETNESLALRLHTDSGAQELTLRWEV